MRSDKLSKGYLTSLDVDDINNILRELGTCESVVSLVDVSNNKKLDNFATKLCRAPNGGYFNIVYSPSIVSDKSLKLIIKDTEEVWKILNKEAIKKGEKTDFVKTIIMQDIIFEDSAVEDSPDGIKFINDDYSVSKYSMRNFSSIDEYKAVQDKMTKSLRDIPSENFFGGLLNSMSLDEVNGLLELLEIDDAIEELIDLDFEDSDYVIDSYIGKNKHEEYLIVALVPSKPNSAKINEFKLFNEAVQRALSRKGVEKPLLKNYIIDMGRNS